MEIDPTTLVLLGVICVVLGFIASGLLNTLRDDSQPEPTDEGIDMAPPGGKKGRYTPVVRLWRERQSNRLIVEIDGKSLVSPGPLNPTQRERLEKAERDLRSWLGMGLAGYHGSISAEPPAVEASATQSAAEPAPEIIHLPAASSSDQPAPPVQPGIQQPSAPYSGTRLYTAPIPAPPSSRSTRGKSATEPSPLEEAAATISANKSIVAQIEDILQDMLAGTAYSNRGIHLIEDPFRGVIVSVDASHYEGIESVPDLEIKAIIRSAVAEWEKHQ